jgi:transcriptional regulator with XRE-family HTH domain
LGVSQEEFAEFVGMHRTQYGAIEQGVKDCRLSTLLRVSDGLGIELWKLVRSANLD